jgi:hypothetical protein
MLLLRGGGFFDISCRPPQSLHMPRKTFVMMKLISAVIASIQRGLITSTAMIADFTSSVIALPFQVFGFGALANMPSQPPVFKVPVDSYDLAADLLRGPSPNEKVRDLDREGVNSVFKLAKMTKDERAETDLSAVERDDVRALLLTMTQSELDALTKAGPGAVRRFLIGGDGRVWGVPSVKPEDVLPPSDTELAMKLRAVKAAMAKASGGSKPFTMPTL